MTELSVLQRARKSDVHPDPFPYVVIENALPDALYERLAETFPSPESLGTKDLEDNSRWNYSASAVQANSTLPQLWRDFIAYHVSADFYREIAELFFDTVHALYPERFPNRQSLINMPTGVRKVDSFAQAGMLMDAQIAGNTPVIKASSVRTTHIDIGSKLYSGLFYMRPKGYDATGGDLTISRFRPDIAHERRHEYFNGAYVDEKNVEHVKTIAYDKNVLVLFINSLHSLHGVTVRRPTDKSRLFVNLVGEIEPELYSMPKLPRGRKQAKNGVTKTKVQMGPVAALAALARRLTS
jgi:hypothetical protein